MNSNPGACRPIVLVHGAWHGAWCWAALQAALDERGLISYAIDLPGHGASTLPLGDLHGDADHVGAVLDRLALTDVVLVGHSYGGAVITDAAAARTDLAHLVYLTAFAPGRRRIGDGPAERAATGGDRVAGVHASAMTTARSRSTRRARSLRSTPNVRRRSRRPPSHGSTASRWPRSRSPFGRRSTTIPSTYVFCGRDRGHPSQPSGLPRRAVRVACRSRHRSLADDQRRRRSGRHPRRSRHVRRGHGLGGPDGDEMTAADASRCAERAVRAVGRGRLDGHRARSWTVGSAALSRRPGRRAAGPGGGTRRRWTPRQAASTGRSPGSRWS